MIVLMMMLMMLEKYLDEFLAVHTTTMYPALPQDMWQSTPNNDQLWCNILQDMSQNLHCCLDHIHCRLSKSDAAVVHVVDVVHVENATAFVEWRSLHQDDVLCAYSGFHVFPAVLIV